jgi:hypothetical protein
MNVVREKEAAAEIECARKEDATNVAKEVTSREIVLEVHQDLDQDQAPIQAAALQEAEVAEDAILEEEATVTEGTERIAETVDH